MGDPPGRSEHVTCQGRPIREREESEATNERETRILVVCPRPRAGKISLFRLRPSDYTFLPSEFFAKILFSTFSRLFIAFFDMPS